jgi:hypothetical protein
MNQARLPDARNAFEQHVAAGQEAGDRIRHQLFVTYDAPSDFFRDANEVFLKMIDVLFDGCSHLLRWK